MIFLVSYTRKNLNIHSKCYVESCHAIDFLWIIVVRVYSCINICNMCIIYIIIYI